MAYEASTPLAAREAQWWDAWRGRDYSWDGLAAKLGHGSGTLQDIWALESERLIAEPGTPRRWTRWHCPFVFADGSLSPKASWSAAEWHDLDLGLRTRLAMGTRARPCRLDGVVIDGLHEGESEVPDEAAFLWLLAPFSYVRGDVDLSHAGMGLCDFHGAWFGGRVDLTGARVLDGDMLNIVMARLLVEPVVVAPVFVAKTVAEVEAVPEIMVTPVEVEIAPGHNRTGLWAVIAIAAVAVAAGAAWLLHGL